jgi:uncharacterized protein YndB with AHSA1/START domain
MPDRRRTSRTAIGSVHIEQDVTIDAPPWRVFDALTKDVAAWWATPYMAGEAPRRLVLEAELGGRFYEEWPGGGGALLARVTSLKRAAHLELTGPIGHYGTVHGRTRFDLKPSESGTGTVVSLSARVIGEAMSEASYIEEWNELLNVRLKSFVEAGRRFAPGEPLQARMPAEAPAPAPTPKTRKPRTRSATPRSQKAAASPESVAAGAGPADGAPPPVDSPAEAATASGTGDATDTRTTSPEPGTPDVAHAPEESAVPVSKEPGQ